MRSKFSVEVISWLTVTRVSRISTLRSAINRLPTQFVHRFTPADQRSAIHNWRDNQRKYPVLPFRSASSSKSRLFRTADQNRLTVVRNVPGDSFTWLLHAPRRCRRIQSRLVHQLQALIPSQQPHIDRGTYHHFAEFVRDDRQQFIHLQCRCE